MFNAIMKDSNNMDPGIFLLMIFMIFVCIVEAIHNKLNRFPTMNMVHKINTLFCGITNSLDSALGIQIPVILLIKVRSC